MMMAPNQLVTTKFNQQVAINTDSNGKPDKVFKLPKPQALEEDEYFE
jgi:hypothetical protein